MSHHKSARILLTAVILLTLVGRMWGDLREVEPHGDESLHIWLGSLFQTLFVEHNVSGPEWGGDFWNLTVAPLPRYLFGFTYWSLGFPKRNLPNKQYNFGKSYEENVATRAFPRLPLLWTERLGVTFLTLLSVVLVYQLGCMAGGWETGLLAILLFALSPATLLHGRRAMEEPALILFSLASLVALERAARAFLRRRAWSLRRVLGWSVLSAALAGLAVASKLNGLTIVATLVATFGLLLVARLREQFVERRSLRGATRDAPVRAAAAALPTLAVVPVLILVLIYPFLYQAPLGRLRWLVSERISWTHDLEKMYPADALPDLPARAGRATEMLLATEPWLGANLGPVAQAAMAAVGLVALGAEVRRGGRRRVVSLVLLVALAMGVGATVAFISVGWDRYYYPLLPYVSIITALGVTTVFRWAGRRAART